ncbi:MAG: CYTH and CHAD domain-containing protein [Mycobacteriales bacterium]
MTSGAREEETKFGVHGLFVLPDLLDAEAGIVTVVPRPRLNLRATYVDTPSLRLAREGITLRHRTGEGAARWTLKLPTKPATKPAKGGDGDGLVRDEITVFADAAAVPADLLELLVGVLRGDPVGPVAVLSTHRVTLELLDEDGRVLGEVVDDTVSLLEGRRVVSRFREIEIERGDAPAAAEASRAAGRRLLAGGAVAGEQLPKVVRALGPQAQLPSDLPPPPRVTPRSPASDLVLWSLRTGLIRLVGSDLGVRRVQDDAVHQMRVACRRLRSDLRTFAPLVEDPRLEIVRAELAWLAGSLGEARDLEVLQVRLRDTATRDLLCPIDPTGLAAITQLLAEQETAALAAARGVLRTERYVALLRLLVEVATEPGLTRAADSPCRDILPALVGRPWRQLSKQCRRLTPTDPDDDWHRARILAKRARYAAEVAAVALGKDAKATASAATAVQELLGEHQDAAVAADRMLELATAGPAQPGFVITCARLAERERGRLAAVRLEFPGRWASARRGRATRWLTG